LSKSQEKASSRSCKTPHNHHHFHHHHNCFRPPCRHKKKLTPIMPLNNNECPGDQILPLNLISHQCDAGPQNRRLQRPWPNFGNKFGNTISSTGGQTVLYRYLTWRTGNCKMFPSGLCSPCRFSKYMCHTQSSPWFNLLTTTAFIAPRQSTLQISYCPRSRKPSLQQCKVSFFLLHGRVKVKPPQLSLVLLCSQGAAFQLVPLP
jgi:hypothetical protein